MKICFILFSFSNGGIGRVTSIIANELNKHDDVDCCALGYTMSDEISSVINRFQVQYTYHSNISMKNAFLKQHYIKKVKKFIKENRIDIIVACGAMFYPISVIVAKVCHVKVICWEHTAPNVTWDYKFQKEAREFGAKFSDCNLLLTKQAKRIFDKQYSEKKNFQIYNPIDAELYDQEVNYNKSSRKIVSVGRFCYQKNFNRLVQIASEFLTKHQEWEWDIYGDGYERTALNKIIMERGLGKQIHLQGKVSDMYAHYSQYAFIVMTSRYEGFPMTLLEASANGLPMVAFDVLTGPCEIIEDGVNGYLCSPESNQQMIEKIELLMADENLRLKMSWESKKTTEKFQLDKICRQWIEMLYSLVL